MDVIPLPPNPDLEQYRNRANDLVEAWRSSHPGELERWTSDWLRAVRQQLPHAPSDFVQGSIDRAIAQLTANLAALRPSDAGSMLAQAELALARVHGFATWASFAQHVEEVTMDGSAHNLFERAADAVVTGDIDSLRELLRRRPVLAREHSARSHAATLLHYAAANGVEDFRQTSPQNAPDVAAMLLDAGAEVDAIADTYGKDRYQTTMNLLVSSVHPAAAGVQVPLVHLLADHGAALNGLDDDSSPLITALAFGYMDAASALVSRGARIDQVTTAAALGRLDLVQSMVIDRETLRAGTRMNLLWIRVPASPRLHIEFAAVWAAMYRRFDVVHWLLDIGVDPRAMDQQQMSLLHWAAARGGIELIDRLVAAGADLELTNSWGGTVLNSTLYFAVNDPFPGVDYVAVIRRLVAHGADVRVAESTGVADIDAVLRSAGN